jgi:hypothetical protein
VSNTGPHATRVFAISELVRSNASIERSTERSESSTGGFSIVERRRRSFGLEGVGAEGFEQRVRRELREDP